MTLTRKILLFIALSYIATIVAIYCTFRLVIENQFRIIEDNEIINSLYRITSAIEDKENNLGLTTADYAGWDDTYQYVQDKNTEYEISNTTADTLKGLEINLMVILDSSNKILLAKTIDSENGTELETPIDVYKLVNTNSKITNFNSTNDKFTGLALINQKPMLIASSPVLTSTKEGPIKGTFIMGKYLDNNLSSTISKSLKLPFEVVIPSKIPAKIKDSLVNDITINITGEKSLTAYILITDVYGQKSIAISTNSNREIHQQWTSVSIVFTSLLSLLGILSILIGTFVLKRILVNPIQRLTSDLIKVRNVGSTKVKVTEKGNDEITHLANEINNVLSTLGHSEQLLMNLNREIAEQKRGVEKEVRERTRQLTDEHLRLLGAIDNSPYGFAMYDSNKQIILTNKTIHEIFQIQRDDLENLAKSLEELPKVIETYIHTFSDCRQHILNNIDYKNKILQITTSPILENYSDIKGVMVTIIDVTEEKTLERSKNELFSIASHELRTPLTAIKGNISLIKDLYYTNMTDLKLKRMFDDIGTASARMIKIVNDFLTTSKLENNKMSYTLKDFSIETIMSSVLSEMETSLKERNINLQYKPALDTQELMVHADPDKTSQVFINLIANSIKYTKDGSITVIVDKVGNFIEIEISDTGKGIAPEYQQLLFKKFQQAGASIYARDVSQGTGLGLYISKLIVEGMGGKLWLKSSEVNVGTSFVFTLPTKKG